jgi:hypothetical protein
MQAEATLKGSNASQTQTDAAMKEADAAMITSTATVTQYYARLPFGVATILLSVVAVIYAIRKPKI